MPMGSAMASFHAWWDGSRPFVWIPMAEGHRWRSADACHIKIAIWMSVAKRVECSVTGSLFIDSSIQPTLTIYVKCPSAAGASQHAPLRPEALTSMRSDGCSVPASFVSTWESCPFFLPRPVFPLVSSGPKVPCLLALSTSFKPFPSKKLPLGSLTAPLSPQNNSFPLLPRPAQTCPGPAFRRPPVTARETDSDTTPHPPTLFFRLPDDFLGPCSEHNFPKSRLCASPWITAPPPPPPRLQNPPPGSSPAFSYACLNRFL